MLIKAYYNEDLSRFEAPLVTMCRCTSIELIRASREVYRYITRCTIADKTRECYTTLFGLVYSV